MAALRGERDIAVGNVIGSNLFNILAIAGIAALVTPGGLKVAASLVRFDRPVMLAVAFACLPIFVTGHRIARWEGALFLGCYLTYAAYLLLDATGHAALPAYGGVVLGFVLPLTAVTLIVLWVRISPRPAYAGKRQPARPAGVPAARGGPRTRWTGYTRMAFANPVTRILSRIARTLPVDPARGVTAALALSAAGRLLARFLLPVFAVYIAGALHEAVAMLGATAARRCGACE